VLDHPRLMMEMRAHRCFVPVIRAAEPWKQPANFRWEEFNAAVQQVFTPLWLGRVTIDQALASARTALQAVLDKPVARAERPKPAARRLSACRPMPMSGG
jgi:hypothetical protein